MIEVAYYHDHGYRTLFINRFDLLLYLRTKFPTAAGFEIVPSKREVIQVREDRTCTEHPQREAVGYYTACDTEYRPTGEVYLCSTCTERRGDAWLELGDLHKVQTTSAQIYVTYPDDEKHYVARVVSGEEKLVAQNKPSLQISRITV